MVLGDRQAHYDVGSARQLASARWKEMSEEEQAPYIAKAREDNDARRHDSDGTRDCEGSDAQPRA